MAAVTVTNVRRLGGQVPHFRGRAVIATITHTASYATGGEDLPIANLKGMMTVEAIAPLSRFSTGIRWKGLPVSAATNLGAVPKLSTAASLTAPKIQLFIGTATPAEVGAATNVSTISYDCLILGK